MRVCLLTLDFPPFRTSGLTVYAEKIARGLVERDHAVTVVASKRPGHDRLDAFPLSDSISMVRVPLGRMDWIGFGWQAAHYLRAWESDFDVIHFVDVHFAYAYRGRFVASAFQSFRQRLTSHGGRPYHTNRRNFLFRLLYYNAARWFMEKPAVRRAQHIIMPSRATQQEFIQHYGVSPTRTSLVYLGIDVPRFSELPTQSEACRQLGLPLGMPILLYVGFSTPRKGVEFLAQALRMMELPARLVMVGKWEARYQERFLDALGEARSRVHVVGYVPDAQLLTYFAAADAFVFPSLLEGFGIPLVEAMGAGLPVVTTMGGSAGEVVGEAGLVVPPADSAALASALDRIVRDRDLARRLSHAGKGRVQALFDERRMATEIESIYMRSTERGA